MSARFDEFSQEERKVLRKCLHLGLGDVTAWTVANLHSREKVLKAARSAMLIGGLLQDLHISDGVATPPDWLADYREPQRIVEGQS
jgi:hypothetical protein